MSIMLEIAHAEAEQVMWERRLQALKAMYAPERPCFADRDGEWCLRDFLNYAERAIGGGDA